MKKNATSGTAVGESTSQSPSSDKLAQEAREAVHNVSQRVKETAGEAIGEVRDQAESVVRQQQEYFAEKLDCVCEALHDSAERLRKEDAAPFAAVIDQASVQVDNLSSFLREKELRDMYEGAQNWARRNPVLFLGGCFVAGLVIARVLKSTGSASPSIDEGADEPDFGTEPAYRPRDVGQSRFKSQSGPGEKSSMGAQYGGSAFTPSTTPSAGETGPRESAGSWEEP